MKDINAVLTEVCCSGPGKGMDREQMERMLLSLRGQDQFVR